MNFFSMLRGFNFAFRRLVKQANYHEQYSLLLQRYFEDQKILLGKFLVEEIKKKKQIKTLSDVEFSVFSQWGDDGIIQFLIHNIEISDKVFIEFGVEDYKESNTRFLLINDNWSGLVMDAKEDNISRIKNSGYYWKYDLTAKHAFVDCDNINGLISEQELYDEIGILHMDIDGNEYWIWKAINVITPVIVIVEYNSIFGIEREIVIPYDRKFQRSTAHFSNLYAGSSLKALYKLGNEKGYAFIGCNSAGNNAYFIKRNKLNNKVKEVSLKDGYVLSKFRESRDMNGNLNYVRGEERLNVIRGMPVYNLETDEFEKL